MLKEKKKETARDRRIKSKWVRFSLGRYPGNWNTGNSEEET